MQKIIFDNQPKIFTTGAFLNPVKVTDHQGKEIWLWYVSEFVDDSFKDGNVYNPKETGRSKRALLSASG
jgi:hypothetical protein